MALLRRAAVLAAALGATLALWACYSPDVRECTITCGASGACPSGTTCLADNFCHASSASTLCNLIPDAKPGTPDGKTADARPGEPDARPGTPDARVADARPGEPDAPIVVPDAPVPDAPVPDGPPDAPPGCQGYTEDVDTVGKPLFPSVGLDPAGNLHVSYIRSSSDEIWYAEKSPGGSWQRQMVDTATAELKGQFVDAFGGVHLAYSDLSGSALSLWYSHRAPGADGFGSPELISDQGSPIDASIVVDALGAVHVAYFDDAAQELDYATRPTPGSDWKLDTIDNVGAVGAYPSLAISPTNGRLFVSYQDLDNTSLKLARLVSGKWQAQTLDNAADVGAYTSLAIDGFGNLHVAYADVTNGAARYLLVAAGGGLPLKLPADTGKTGRWNSIGLDAAGNVYISTDAFGDNDLHLARRIGANAFTMTPVDQTGNVGRHTWIAVEPAGGAHIVYVDDTHGTVKHAFVCPPTGG